MLRSASNLFKTRAVTMRAFSTTTPRFTDKFTFELPESSFETFNIDSPSLHVEISKDKLLDIYTRMNTIRCIEKIAGKLLLTNKARGFVHLSAGQEAISCGIEAAITDKDHVITSYRCHGFIHNRTGGAIESIFAEIMGRSTGMSKGKGGSMHMYTPNFHGGNGIVGAQVPVGLGVAFAQKYSKTPYVSFALYGDGASNQGQIHESFNLAKLWNLPCVFICENNLYGMGTAATRASAQTEFYNRVNYMPGIKINGMDPILVYQAIQYGRERAMSGQGPLIIEMSTYRYSGHSADDAGKTYRTDEEVKYVYEISDPIIHFKQRLLDRGVAPEEDLEAIERNASKQVDEAFERADAAPLPSAEELARHTYIQGSWDLPIRGRTPSEFYHN